MVTDTHTLVHITAGGSTVATFVSLMAHWLPVLQGTAAIVAILSGTVSLYFAIKKRSIN